MKAKHWLLSGVGCIAFSILAVVALDLFWMDQVRSFEGFVVVQVVRALVGLLFFGGIVVLFIGFIMLAKEPRAGAHKAPARQESSGSD
jgi:hypothetical protein